jgi:hypothetical protein
MRRTLTLRSETLAELAVDELASVVGGQQQSGATLCPVLDCLVHSYKASCSWSCPTE